jgi:subfamily B ATP-binding cassette protein MsbA
VKLAGFLLRYARRYTAWAVLAATGIMFFAAATTALVGLVEPIFAEVLLAEEAPLGEEEGVAGEAAIRLLEQGREMKRPAEALGRAYQSLKRRLGVEEHEVVYFVPLLFVAVFLLRSLADFLSGYAFQHIGLGMTTDIRNDLYRRLLEQSSRFHAAHPSGELVSRVVNDVAMMQNAVSNRLLDLFQQSLTLVLLVALLLSIHLRLGLVCLVAAPVLLYPIVRFGQGMRRTSHRSQERLADLANLVAEGVRGHRVVKAFNMEAFEFRRFAQATRRHLRVNLWAQMLSNLSSPVVESLAVLGAAALLVWAGRSIRGGEMTAPALLMFLANLAYMYDPVRKLNKVNLVLQQSLAAAQRVRALMEIPNEIHERPGARRVAGVEREVAFERVSFGYDGRPVLHEVTLRLRVGEVVALVGPSGAGKSTLVNLLPRFFDPDSGRVAIDGVDIRDLRLADLRQLIGLVTQDTVLFDDTVRNNIAYGRSEAPLDLVLEAAAAAYADEFIVRLPQGYDTVLGESGLRLSGGQRQRMAIARALFKNAPLLILDEATSQLDSESESLVQKALHNLMQGRTTLVIAHRLATVVRADRIVVLDAGRVVEEGSHRQLLDVGGVYKRLYDLQFRV